jgi:hypothetical protein
MPHNFIRVTADTPNPGRRRRQDVDTVCTKHGGHLEYLWFDHDTTPSHAYLLVRDGNVDEIRRELDADQAIRLFAATD